MSNRIFNKTIILCDLENSLSDSSHRNHLQKTNIEKFNNDFVKDPIDKSIFDLISMWYNNNINIKIVIISSRRSKYKNDAEKWLLDNKVEYNELIVQTDKDKRTPMQFKTDFLKENRNKIIFAIEDVPKTCDMIKSHYVPVVQVKH